MTLFYVYWIASQNRCYIGATVDPKKRLRQHNEEIKGGAFRTKSKGPWHYHCVISGFRTWHEALCFEWAFKYYTKRCRGNDSRENALATLMMKEKWTINSPPSSEVPLNVEYNPEQYGQPPENYEAVKPPLEKNKKKNTKEKFKKLYGVKY